MEHFSEEELSEMKNVVIKLHMQQRKRSMPLDKTGGHLDAKIRASRINEPELISETSINEIPNELVLKIFSYLTNAEKLKSAKVCKKWNNLVYDQSNWKELVFSLWKSSKFCKNLSYK